MDTQLPDNIPDLIRLAIYDLELCEKDPKYEIDMAVWHQPRRKCAVCLAGSVMSQTLSVDTSKWIGPYDFGLCNGDKLDVLDDLRRGFVWLAYHKLERTKPDMLDGDYSIPLYGKKNSAKFKNAMYALADLIQIAEMEEAALPTL